MNYLYAESYPDYPDTDKSELVFSVPRSIKKGLIGYEEVANELKKAFPERAIYSPLDQAPKGSLIVCVYMSPSKYGIGRHGGNFQLWAIGKDEDEYTELAEQMGLSSKPSRETFLSFINTYYAADETKAAQAIGYANEAEHQDGDAYWEEFSNLAEALQDFELYIDNSDEEN